MKLREPSPEDIAWISQTVEERGYDLILPAEHNVIIQGVAYNGHPIGYGILKNFAEALIVLDMNRSKRDRIDALHALMTRAIEVARHHHVENLFAFAESETFAKLLMKHLGFKPAFRLGIPLVKEIG